MTALEAVLAIGGVAVFFVFLAWLAGRWLSKEDK